MAFAGTSRAGRPCWAVLGERRVGLRAAHRVVALELPDRPDAHRVVGLRRQVRHLHLGALDAHLLGLRAVRDSELVEVGEQHRAPAHPQHRAGGLADARGHWPGQARGAGDDLGCQHDQPGHGDDPGQNAGDQDPGESSGDGRRDDGVGPAGARESPSHDGRSVASWTWGVSVPAPVGSSEVYKVRAFMRVATVVLAAGTSQRFGRPKQFEPLGDATVIQLAVRAVRRRRPDRRGLGRHVGRARAGDPRAPRR